MKNNMQDIKQHLQLLNVFRKQVVAKIDINKLSVHSFEEANTATSSPLFLTKISTLLKEQSKLHDELKTFDEAISTFDAKFNSQQQEAISTYVPPQKRTESVGTWT